MFNVGSGGIPSRLSYEWMVRGFGSANDVARSCGGIRTTDQNF